MSETHIYDVPPAWAKNAWVDEATYTAMYRRSVEDPAGFWGEMGKRLDWIKPYTKVKNTNFGPGNVSIKWYEDGTLNVGDTFIAGPIVGRVRALIDARGKPVKTAGPSTPVEILGLPSRDPKQKGWARMGL